MFLLKVKNIVYLSQKTQIALLNIKKNFNKSIHTTQKVYYYCFLKHYFSIIQK